MAVAAMRRMMVMVAQMDDKTLRENADETKDLIKETLLNHHIEHSTIELESKYHCTGMVCEERQDNNK